MSGKPHTYQHQERLKASVIMDLFRKKRGGWMGNPAKPHIASRGNDVK
jgi:hypothetical protein